MLTRVKISERYVKQQFQKSSEKGKGSQNNKDMLTDPDQPVYDSDRIKCINNNL